MILKYVLTKRRDNMNLTIVEILKECKEMILCWSDYANEYNREKHNLDGDIEKIDEWIKNFQTIDTEIDDSNIIYYADGSVVNCDVICKSNKEEIWRMQ